MQEVVVLGNLEEVDVVLGNPEEGAAVLDNPEEVVVDQGILDLAVHNTENF